jgi:hypothetical protein
LASAISYVSFSDPFIFTWSSIFHSKLHCHTHTHTLLLLLLSVTVVVVDPIHTIIIQSTIIVTDGGSFCIPAGCWKICCLE